MSSEVAALNMARTFTECGIVTYRLEPQPYRMSASLPKKANHSFFLTLGLLYCRVEGIILVFTRSWNGFEDPVTE